MLLELRRLRQWFSHEIGMRPFFYLSLSIHLQNFNLPYDSHSHRIWCICVISVEQIQTIKLFSWCMDWIQFNFSSFFFTPARKQVDSCGRNQFTISHHLPFIPTNSRPVSFFLFDLPICVNVCTLCMFTF